MHAVLEVAGESTAFKKLFEHHFAPVSLGLVVAAQGAGERVGFVAELFGLLHKAAHLGLKFAALLNALQVGLLDTLPKLLEFGSKGSK